MVFCFRPTSTRTPWPWSGLWSRVAPRLSWSSSWLRGRGSGAATVTGKLLHSGTDASKLSYTKTIISDIMCKEIFAGWAWSRWWRGHCPSLAVMGSTATCFSPLSGSMACCASASTGNCYRCNIIIHNTFIIMVYESIYSDLTPQ